VHLFGDVAHTYLLGSQRLNLVVEFDQAALAAQAGGCSLPGSAGAGGRWGQAGGGSGPLFHAALGTVFLLVRKDSTGFAQILERVPPVGDLQRVGRAQADSLANGR
jgi:hypothetical protein